MGAYVRAGVPPVLALCPPHPSFPWAQRLHLQRQTTMAEKTNNELSTTPSPPPAHTSYYPPRQRKVHDSRVTFEEYHYYAQRTREEQLLLDAPQWQWRTVFASRNKAEDAAQDNLPAPSSGQIVTDEEWADASRAFRTASWGAVFYLVSNVSKAIDDSRS